ncbi:MAG: histidine phosphatase family protein [Syntrophobacteraceae bacterium]
MNQLILVRHGQASSDGMEFGALSAVGVAQVEALADYWGRTGMPPGILHSGTLTRQRESAERFAAGLGKSGIQSITKDAQSDFDELDHLAVLRAFAQAQNPDIGIDSAWDPFRNDKEKLRKTLRPALRAWARREIEVAEGKSWNEFRTRCVLAAKAAVRETQSPDPVTIFTSSGVIAACMQEALELKNDIAIEIALTVANSAVSRFSVTVDGGLRVHTFNSVSHIELGGNQALLTYL